METHATRIQALAEACYLAWWYRCTGSRIVITYEELTEREKLCWEDGARAVRDLILENTQP